MPGPFDTDPRLTAVSMLVKPKGLIADMVCPRVGVPSEKFIYTKGDPQETHTIPDTRIGRTSRANQVEFGAKQVTDSTEDHGLEAPVPRKDIELARSQPAQDGRPPWDPMAEATETTSTLVSLAREKRTADLIFTAGNYVADLTATLSGASQWSHKDADPLKAITDALDKPLVRPNVMVIGQAAWTALRRHPKIVESVIRSGAGAGAAGIVPLSMVADLFELDAIHVGRSWHSSSKKGQAASYSRLWGKHCSLLHLAPGLGSAQSAMPTFCFTAEWLGRRVTPYTDESRGIGGSEIVKVVECVKELIAWKGVGYHFKNAVA